MKKITIEVPDNHGDALTVSCIGGAGASTVNVCVGAFDLDKGTKLIYDGKNWTQEKEVCE